MLNAKMMPIGSSISTEWLVAQLMCGANITKGNTPLTAIHH